MAVAGSRKVKSGASVWAGRCWMSKRFAFACVCLLILGKPVFAQNLNDIIRGGIQRSMREAALYEWRTLPSGETACIEQNLHRQGLSVDAFPSCRFCCRSRSTWAFSSSILLRRSWSRTSSRPTAPVLFSNSRRRQQMVVRS
jgi:hypothetical protein